MIAVFDYGMGNLYSIRNGFVRVGVDVEVVSDALRLREADGVVIPGVGSFDAAIRRIEPVRDVLVEVFASGIPVLGVCLGMQLFFERSEEGVLPGLGLLRGSVVRLPDTVLVPQMGWNELKIKRDVGLLEGVVDGDFFYFVHSYYCRPVDEGVVDAVVEYGCEVAAVVVFRNLFGVQFHPEKSGPKGLKVLENFAGFVRC